MPRDHQGNTLPPMAAILNRSESFELEKGRSRDDISFLATAEGALFTTSLPDKINEPVAYKDLLKIVKTSDDKPTL